MDTLPAASEPQLPFAPLTPKTISDRLKHRAMVIALTAVDGAPISPAQVEDFRLYYQADNVRGGWCRNHTGAPETHCPSPTQLATAVRAA